MKARLSIVAGLIVGVAAAGLLLGGLLALAPDPPALASPTQALDIATPSPSSSPSAKVSIPPSPSASTLAGKTILPSQSAIVPGVDVSP